MLLTLIVLGRYLEHLAKGKTSRVITQLLQLQSPLAILIQRTEGTESTEKSETEVEIDAKLIQRGDILKVGDLSSKIGY